MVDKPVEACIPALNQLMLLDFAKDGLAAVQRDTIGTANLGTIAEESTDMQRERTRGDAELGKPGTVGAPIELPEFLKDISG